MNVSPDHTAASKSLTPERLAAARSHGDDVMKFDFAKAYLWMLIFSCLISLATHVSTLVRPPQILPSPVTIELSTVEPKMLDLATRVNEVQINAFHFSVEVHDRAIVAAKRGLAISVLTLLIAGLMLKLFNPTRAPAITILCLVSGALLGSAPSIIVMAIFLVPALRSAIRHKKFLESKDSPALTLRS